MNSLSVPVGFWDVTELITLRECEELALEGVDIRFDNGRAYIVIYEVYT